MDGSKELKDKEISGKSRKWYEFLLNNLADAVFVFHISEPAIPGKFIEVNDSACKSIGYSRDELLGMSITDINPPDKLKNFSSEFKIIQKEKRMTVETEHIRKDGRIFPVETNIFLFELDGKPTYFAIARDITERKAKEIKLIESEEKYRSFVETATDAIITIDNEGLVTSWNYGAEKLLGFKVEEMMGENCSDKTVPEDLRDEQLDLVTKVIDVGFIQGYETELLTKSGVRVPVEMTVGSMHDKNKGLIGFSAIIRDISQRKRAGEVLRESEEKFRALVERSLVSVYLLNDEGFIYHNEVGTRMFGYNPKEILEIKPIDLVHPDDREIVTSNIEKRLKGKIKSLNYTFRGLKKDGGLIECEVFGQRIKYHGKPAIIGTCVDITKRKKAEEDLTKSTKQIERINRLNEKLIFPGDIGKKLALITDEIVDIFKADFARIWIIESGDKCKSGCHYSKVKNGSLFCRIKDNCLHLKSSSGRYTHLDGKKHSRVPFGIYKVGKIASGKFQKIITNSITKDRQFNDRKWAKKLGLVSFAGFRLTSEKGAPLGVLALFSKNIISPKEEALLENLSNTTSQLILNSINEKALKESEKKFRSLAEQSPNMIFINKNGKIVFVNRMCRKIMGYTIEEFYSPDFDFIGIIAPESIELINKNYKKHERGEDVPPSEYSLFSKGGKKFHAIISTKLIDYEGGKAILGIVTDITERKKSEDELKKYRDLLEKEVEVRTQEIINQRDLTELITEGIEEGILLFSNDLEILWANKKQRELLGLSRDKIIGKSCHEIFEKCDRSCEGDSSDCIVDKVRNIGNPDSGIVLEYDKQGRKTYNEISAYPLRAENKVQGIIRITRDVTQRINYQKKINELKEFNENIVDKMEEGVLVENDEGYMTFANPRMYQMVKTTSKEIIGKHWSEIFSADSKKKVQNENERVMDGKKVRYEATLSYGGFDLPVIVSSTPLMEKGIYVGSLKVFVDISERKRSEEELLLKSLKYKVDKGKTYLITEKSLDKGIDVFKDLINAGYEGLLISRTHMDDFKQLLNKNVEYIWLGETEKSEYPSAPELNILFDHISENMSRNRVILIDRLDYLIVQNGFNEVLRFINRLNEKAFSTKSTLLIVIDPDTLSTQQASMLDNEIIKLEPKVKIRLEKELMDILIFINNRTKEGNVVVHNDVTNYFNISRPTTVKRLKGLKLKGLVIDNKMGKCKSLDLTRKGKDLF